MVWSFPPRFSIKLSSPELVPPKIPTPKEKKALSDLDDQASLRYQMPGLWFYENKESMVGCDPASVIKEGLGKALVTRFTCGGIALGVRFNHTMVDGYGMVLFLKAVCELALGGSTPSILPVWDRETLSATANPNLTCSHAVYEAPCFRNNFKLFDFEWWANKIFNVEKLASQPLYFFFPKILKPIFVQSSFIVGPKEIQALRDQAMAQDYGRCTTFELITACLWKCRTIALQSNPNATVRLTFPTDMRQKSLAGLKLSPGYYGNAIVMQSATSSAKLLCDSPITYAIQLIREAKNKVNADYVKSVIDFMVTRGRPRMSVLRNMLVSDISRIGMEKIDFGWGDAIYAGASIAAYGVTFLERPKSSDNTNEKIILVPISLPHVYMQIFTHEFKKMTSSS
nr:methanol O-anthraniloyltransferase-like [Ipomoea batatas]